MSRYRERHSAIVLPELTEGPYFVDEQLSLQMEVLKKRNSSLFTNPRALRQQRTA
jgi:hypothetical protein